MPREREAYRDNIEIIREKFPDKAMFRPGEVCEVVGFKSIKTVKKLFTFQNGYISIADLARQMSCAK